MQPLLAPLAAFALLAAAPSPVPSVSATPVSSASASPVARTLSVVCDRTPLYLFVPGAGVNRPIRSGEPQALLGQRFGLVSGPRTTLEGFRYYETNIEVVEPGYRGLHYWLSERCAIPSG